MREGGWRCEGRRVAMPRFVYRAKDAVGKTVKGMMSAADEMELATVLEREKAQYLLVAREVRAAKGRELGGHIKRKDLITFTHHLASLLSAGISVYDALQEMSSRGEARRLKGIIDDVSQKVAEGRSFSEALQQHPKAFPELYVSIVKAGETTGTLENALQDLLRFLEWQEALAADVKGATTYPLIVLSSIAIIVTLLFIFVIPRLTHMLIQLKAPMPLPTQILIALATALHQHSSMLLAGVVVAIIGYALARGTPSGRLALDRLKLSIPIIGGLNRNLALSRFSHYFAILYRAGIGIVSTLNVLEPVVGNKVLGLGIREACERVQRGESIVKSLEACGEFPEIVLRMIALGETTGRLDEALDKASQYYDREVPASVKKVLSVLQPALIFALAGTILFIALAFYLPMFQVVGSIKGVP